jgi:hypothetical protein
MFKKVAFAVLLAFVSVSPALPTVLSGINTAIGTFLVMAGVEQSCSVAKFDTSGSRLFLSGLAVLVANGQSADYRKMFLDKDSVGGPQNFMSGICLVSVISLLTSGIKLCKNWSDWGSSDEKDFLRKKASFSGGTMLLSGFAAYASLSKVGCHLQP